MSKKETNHFCVNVRENNEGEKKENVGVETTNASKRKRASDAGGGCKKDLRRHVDHLVSHGWW